MCLAFLDSLQAADTHSPSDTDYHSVRVLTTLQGHISSVKALSSSPSHLGSSCKLLFSGGARASLKVWLITSKYVTSEIYLFYGYTADMAIWYIFVSQIIYFFGQIWQLVFQRPRRSQMSHWKQSCTSTMVHQDSESDNQRRSLLKHLQSAGSCLSLPSLFLSCTPPVEDTVLSAATILLLLGALMAW